MQKVRTGSELSLPIRATIVPECMPPLRKEPKGTSPNHSKFDSLFQNVHEVPDEIFLAFKAVRTKMKLPVASGRGIRCRIVIGFCYFQRKVRPIPVMLLLIVPIEKMWFFKP